MLGRFVRRVRYGLGYLLAVSSAAALEPPPGLETHVAVVAEAWQVARGGIEHGGWWNTFVDASAELAGARVGAPAESRFVAQVHWVENRRHDTDFGAKTGAFNPVSSTMANSHFRVFNLHYRQAAPDGRWDFKVGQIAIDDDFMLSDGAGQFVNPSFGPLASQVATTLSEMHGAMPGYAIYSVAAPGMWLQLVPREGTAWQLGVYHGGPGFDTRGNSGFRWGSASHSGVTVFTEVSTRTTVSGRPLVSKLGAAAHSGMLDDLRAIELGEPDVHRRGLFSVYTVHDLILVGDADAPRLTAFCRLGLSPQKDRSVVTAYADAGLVWNGPLPGRSADVTGIGYSHSRFGAPFRRLSGLGSWESTLEWTYRAALSERIALQADVQWLFNAQRATGSSRGTTAVFGVRGIAEF